VRIGREGFPRPIIGGAVDRPDVHAFVDGLEEPRESVCPLAVWDTPRY
jgi:hypothetical protein